MAAERSVSRAVWTRARGQKAEDKARTDTRKAAPPSATATDLNQIMQVKGIDLTVPPTIEQHTGRASSSNTHQVQSDGELNPYQRWYNIVEEETLRNPMSNKDKLDAFSSKVHDFASSIGVRDDSYAAGIWHGDLITGLLRHDTDFEASESSTAHGTPLQKSTSSPRAPTWSWASVDRSIRFLQSGAYHPPSCPPQSTSSHHPPLVQNLYAYTLPMTSTNPLGSVIVGDGCISLRGQIRPFIGMKGSNEAFASWMSTNRLHLGVDCIPNISSDPDYVFDCDKYVLPLVRKRCDPRCRHSIGCDKDQMAYGLILHFVGQGLRYDGLPALRLARVKSGGVLAPFNFAGEGENYHWLPEDDFVVERRTGEASVKHNVEVFMRCGVAAFYMSSFENVPWQDAVIL